LSNLAPFSFTRRISDNNAPGLYVFHCYRSCTNDRSLADCHTRPDERIRTNPRLGTDRDWRTQQRKIRLGVIVCSCANMSAVGDCYPRPKCHRSKIVNKCLLPDGAFISCLQIPREINCRRRIHMNAATDLCSKTAEQKSPPRETRPGAEPKQRLRETPQYPADQLT